MTMIKICEVRNNQLVIPMPEGFESKRMRVVIDDEDTAHEEKVRLMKQAASDPLFQEDVAAVMEDFKSVDHEHFGDDEDQ